MTLQLTRWSVLVAILALASCTTPADPLEAKARDGDPVAACQLAARELHNCALEKQKWEASEIAARPACISQGITDQQEAYLDRADDSLEDRKVDQILFGVNRIQLTTVEGRRIEQVRHSPLGSGCNPRLR
jgi:hypothetical protein